MLGERLTRLRKARKLTQQQIADALHMTRGTYAQYEIDRRIPEYNTLEKIADFFEVFIDYLVGRESKYSAPTKDQTDNVIRGLIERYKIDVTEPGDLDKLEQLIKLVFDDKRNTKDN